MEAIDTVNDMERFLALVSATSDIIWIANYEGILIPTIRIGQWQAFTGQTLDDSLNDGWKKAVHPEDIQYASATLKSIMSGNIAGQLEYRVRRADGEWRWILSKVVPVADRNNTIKEWIGALTDITDKKKADEEKDALIRTLRNREQELVASEEELKQLLEELQITNEYVREKESQLSAIFNNTTEIIFSLDKNLCVTAMNKGFSALIRNKLKMELKIGDSIMLTLPESEKETYKNIYANVLSGLPFQQVKEWSDLFTEEFYHPIWDVDQRVTGIVVCTRDISEKKTAEIRLLQAFEEEKKLNEELERHRKELEASKKELIVSLEELTRVHSLLLKSEEKYLAISTSTNDAMYDWDITANKLEWSPGFADIFGDLPAGTDYTIEMWEASLYEEGKEKTLKSLKDALENKDMPIWSFEYKVVKTDGTVVHVAEKGQIMRNELGVACRMVGGLRNVTERNKAIEKLETNENFLSSIVNNMPIGITILDKEGIVIRMNDAYLKTLGLPEGFKVAGSLNLAVYNESSRSDWFKYFCKVCSGEVLLNKEMYIDFSVYGDLWPGRKDNVWLSITMFPIWKNDKVDSVIMAAIDVTQDTINRQKIEEHTKQIIETNKKMAEYRLMALRSVMNPHFLFNSLNSIQSFIATSEQEQAINYLSWFSKLIRIILNSSIKDSNTLAEELEILKLYVSLEKLRFEDKFEVRFIIQENIDLENIEIPSLILQPFVENAILHGLYNKKSNDGRLLIEFWMSDNKICCTIEDNGIGREAARKIKTANRLYKSVGMLVTQERLELVNNSNTLSVEIIDLADADNQPRGTRVIVSIDIE